jgi:putative spermidine/putrescine transport system permease protein
MSVAAAPALIGPMPAWRRHDMTTLLAMPAVGYMLVVFAVPLALLLYSSVRGEAGFSLAGYTRILGDAYYRQVIWNSLSLGLITTAGCVVLGYPAAFAIARAPGYWQVALFALVFLPLTVSIIVKTFGWAIMLRRDGLVNWALLGMGLVDRPQRMLFTPETLYAGMINVFLPFMILPCYSVVRMLDPRLTEAAATLGASPWYRFSRVIFPLSLPGLVAGIGIVFSISCAAYVTPSLLIGERYMTMSQVMAKAYLNLRDWQLGSAMAAILMSVSVLVVLATAWAQRRLARRGGA